MNNKFDLERFKAGECAAREVDDSEFEIYYLADLPNGVIAYKWKEVTSGYWGADSQTREWFETNTTMKPREEWAVVHPTSIHKSYDAAEQDRRNFYSTPDSYITVKIVR